MDDNKQQLNDGLPLIENDPRYQEIRERNLANHNRNFKDWPYDYQKQYLQHNPPAKGKLNLRRDSEEEFRRLYPEDAKRLDAEEATRIYTNPENDPAVQEVKSEVARISQQDREQALSGQWGTIAQQEAQNNLAVDDKFYKRAHIQEWGGFIGKYPKKAEAYSALGNPDVQEALESIERHAQYVKSHPKNKQSTLPVQETQTTEPVIQNASKINAFEPEPPKKASPEPSTEKNYQLVKTLTSGIEDLKKNPGIQIVSGIDRKSFEILVSRLSGSSDFGHVEGLGFIQSQLLRLQPNPQIEGLNLMYQKTSANQSTTDTPAEFRLKSQAFISTVTSLPPKLLGDKTVIEQLAGEFFDTRQINDQLLESRITDAVTKVIGTKNTDSADANAKIIKNALIPLSDKTDLYQSLLVSQLTEFQKVPLASNIAGIPRASFELVLQKTTKSKFSISNPKDVVKAINQIKEMPSGSNQLKSTLSLYEMLHRRATLTRLMLATPQGQDLSAEQQVVALNYIPQQVFLASILTNVPEELMDNIAFQNSLEKQLRGYDIASDKNLRQSVEAKVKNAALETNVNLPTETLTKTANFAAGEIKKSLPSKFSPSQAGVFLLASIISSMYPKDSQKISEEELLPVNEESGYFEKTPETPLFGGVLGIGMAFAIPKKRVVGEMRKESLDTIGTSSLTNKNQPPSMDSPPSIPNQPIIFNQPASKSSVNLFSGLSSFFSNTIGKAINIASLASGVGAVKLGLSKVLTGALSMLGLGGKKKSKSGDVSINPLDPNDKHVIIFAALLIAVALLLPLFAPLIISMVESSSFAAKTISGNSASSIDCEAGTGGLNPIIFGQESCPIINPVITPTPNQEQPNPSISPTGGGSGSSLEPSGFPITSNCVTQKPFGSFSHPNSNAVDVIVLGNSPNDKVIRATHDGTVAFAGCGDKCTLGLGYYATIRSSNNQFLTMYGHMQYGSLRVKAGDNINKGQPLGIVDTTGFSTGNHLHYELRAVFGPYYNSYGAVGTILNFLPAQSTWQCNI